RVAVCHTPCTHRKPAIPADAREPDKHDHRVCPAPISGNHAGQPTRFATREQAQEDRQTPSGAEPESVGGHCAHDHQDCDWRGRAASAHALVRVTKKDPATTKMGYRSLKTA